jgi:hypothetical protein
MELPKLEISPVPSDVSRWKEHCGLLPDGVRDEARERLNPPKALRCDGRVTAMGVPQRSRGRRERLRRAHARSPEPATLEPPTTIAGSRTATLLPW